MYCENCGAKIDDDSKFCENCGALVEQEMLEVDETERSSGQENVRASEDLTDLEQLLDMDDTREEAALSEPTVVFTKESLRTEYGETQEEEQSGLSASNEQAEVQEEAESFEEPETFDGRESESTDEEEVSFGLRATSQKTKEPLELEIPDVLKANGDDRLFWEAKAVVRSWEAEDEWQEEDDCQKEPQMEASSTEQPESDRKEEKNIAASDEAAPEMPYEQEIDTDVFEDTVSKRADAQWEQAGPVENDCQEEMEELKTEEPEQTDLLEKEMDAEEPRNGALFCMACGKQLPRGAAFCDACGTPTGEVAPIQTARKRNEHKIALEVLKRVFVKPVEVIENAASEEAFYVGIGFFVLKDLILAILGAVFMGRLTVSLGVSDTWLTGGGDPFGFAAKIFLCGLLLDALWIGLLYGGSLLFKVQCSIRQLTGTCGTASLFSAILLFVAAVLLAFVPPVGVCAVIAAAAVGLISMTKAAGAVLEVDENKRFYLFLAVTVCYIIIVFAVAQLLF